MTDDPSRLDDVFAEALAKTAPKARVSYLDRACADNLELRERVDALLAAHDLASSFLHLPGIDATTPFVPITEGPGSTIGPYKLLEQIGEGGMGVVFMADQERPVRRRIALKVIKPGMDTRQVIARFEAERQALAMMDHPNIAKVLDAGATETGRPYFVMELVRGVPITEYCDQARLSTKDRIVLFQTVCAAIQHAHQKGIIHRDLKPSNIMVTLHDDRAVPKVIDFGVAKATQSRLTERTLFTEFRQMIGTPAYMSPEQAQMSGLDVDTRSDVYSLGVLLYELLTGTTPIEHGKLSSASYDDVRRLICEVDPPSPSARLSTMNDEVLTTLAQRRHCEPAQLGLNLKSDLDWIVMRCLEKDRSRRYESASVLALDLQRYLDEQPIEARPPTRRYRLGKFVRRNKVGVLAGTAIVGSLVVGMTLASIGMIQARRQAAIAKSESARSEQVAKFLTDMLSAVRPGVAQGRDTTLLREILGKTAKRVEADLKDRPDVQGDLWTTLAGTYAAIDDREEAVRLYEKSVESFQRAGETDQAKLAIALGELGAIQVWLGNSKTGQENAVRGLAMARRLNDPPTIIQVLRSAAQSQLDPEGSIPRTKTTAPYLEEAIQLCESEGKDRVLLADLNSLLAIHINAGGIDNDRSIKLAESSLAFYRQELPGDSVRIARCLHYLGQLYATRGDHERAVKCLSEAVEIDRLIFPLDHSAGLDPIARFATSLEEVGRSDEAISVLRELIERRKRTAGPKDFSVLVATCDLVSVLYRNGLWKEAEEKSGPLLEATRKLNGPEHASTLDTTVLRARVLKSQNKFEPAVPLLQTAYDIAVKKYGQGGRLTVIWALDLANTFRLLKQYDKALQVCEPTIAACKVSVPSDPNLPNLLRSAADSHARLGDFPAARDCLEDSVKVCQKTDWNNLGVTAWVFATSPFEELRNGPRAIEIATTAAQISEFKDAGTMDSLAAAYAEAGDFDSAVATQEKALKLPGARGKSAYEIRLKAYRNKQRTWVGETALELATSTDPKKRNGKRALELALKEAESTEYANAGFLDTLAAAYAENGDFDSAVKWEIKAVELGLAKDKEKYRSRLNWYRDKKRWWIYE